MQGAEPFYSELGKGIIWPWSARQATIFLKNSGHVGVSIQDNGTKNFSFDVLDHSTSNMACEQGEQS